MDATLPLFDDYKVSLEAFEGPLDLLLHLIRKEEVDIYDIPIGRIASQYLAYLEQMRSLDINVAGEFVVMAATLMVIKSRMLLPQEVPAEGEDAEAEELDPRLDLVRQLVEYKRFKEAAERFGVLEVWRGAMFGRGEAGAPGAEMAEGAARKLGDIGLEELMKAFRAVLERAKETVSFGHLKLHRWSVPDKMSGLLSRLSVAEGGRLRFGELFTEGAAKGEIIVTFVALLELLRLRHVRAEQADLFGEVFIEAIPEGTPDSHLPLPSFDELKY
ncbi:MAG: segregation/condensation protein A [Lentisphaeraceae bacterium]|nr:segregation/condensation protein A [Lentisphaeraceae bacterium]